MNREIAHQVSSSLLEIGKKLDNSLAFVKAECNEDAFISYRNAIGQILGIIYIDILRDIYIKHPDLRPKEIAI